MPPAGVILGTEWGDWCATSGQDDRNLGGGGSVSSGVQTPAGGGTPRGVAPARCRMIRAGSYGNSESSAVAAEVYLSRALETLLADREVAVVSPSMSGGFSLPFVAKHSDRVAGYVPIGRSGSAATRTRCVV